MIAEHLDTLKPIFVNNGVVLAYLFGSYAEGLARPSSDMDFAVLLPPDEPRDKFFQIRLNLANALRDVLHKNPDVVVLNDASPLLAHQVVKYGLILYEDPVTQPVIDFMTRTAARYADTRPARALAQAYLEEWLVERRRARTQSPREPYRW